MKRSSIWILVGGMTLGLSLGLGSGCGRASSEAFGGETHWLQACGSPGSGAAECRPGLECVCGVCTSACTDDSSCAGVSDAARCVQRDATPYASSCESVAPERLCVRAADVSAPEENTLPSPDAGTAPDEGPRPTETPREESPEPPSCVETARGCLECNDAWQSLENDARELAESADANVCSSDDDCVVVTGWGCGRQCDLPLNNAFADSVIPQLDDLSRDYCANPGEWLETCSETPACSLGTLCRAGRCISTPAPPCYSRPLDTCELDGDCALVRAFPYDPVGQCFGSDPAPAGCIDADLSCPPVTRPGVDETGNCFLFANCLPFGFGAPNGFERDEHACSDAIATTCSN